PAPGNSVSPPLSGLPADSADVSDLNDGPAAVRTDSVQQSTALNNDFVKPRTDTAIKKKGRGVSGIGDDDYRIVPRKDSL
ncbi:MAG TPA: hypothetical protein VHK91_00490, partial [Flavisolibacter sp.]|nr:hypothetical protein [Flavisolibacter sp.]